MLRHFRDMRAEMLAAIDGLSDDQLTERSLDGWSVKDHLAHLALWDEIRAAEVVRISAGHGSAWQMTEEHVTAFNAMSDEFRRELTLEQVLWEMETSRTALLDAIAAAAPRGLDGSLYGEASLRSTHESQHAAWIRRWRGEAQQG